MLFPSVGGLMSKNTEAMICFISFSHQFSDRFFVKKHSKRMMLYVKKHRSRVGGYMLKKTPKLPLICPRNNTEAIFLFHIIFLPIFQPSVGGYMLTNTEAIIVSYYFPTDFTIPMAAI